MLFTYTRRRGGGNPASLPPENSATSVTALFVRND
jgi:hypothetical protein